MNELNNQIKNKDCQTEFKNNIVQPYAIYRKYDSKIQIVECKMTEMIYM